MITSHLSSGWITESGPCVYVLSLRSKKQRKLYIGRTGTSNNTGISTPFKRLASHLSKRGKTRSCIHDNDLDDAFLKNAEITFTAVSVPLGQQISSEQWLRWKFKETEVLNRDAYPPTEPNLSPETRNKLETLFRTINKG